jgi:hypothetical protein
MNLFFRVYRKQAFSSLLIIGLAISFCPVAAQPCHLRISLITCGRGDDLYATFGHSAVRVVDSLNGGDYIFNYGTFDFDTPHFYWKFTRGKLMYSLSAQDFPSFLLGYREEKRSVTEQVLNLTCAEREAVWQFLQYNYLPQNRYYKYDFLFDNCSTRIRDIFTRIFGPSLTVSDIVPERDLSFRAVINSYLQYKPWEKLGINLMFGMSTDMAMNSSQIMFLPEYLMKGMDSSRVNGKPLVEKKEVLYDPGVSPDQSYPFYLHPLFWLTLVAVFVVFVSFSRRRNITRRLTPWIERSLFFLTGLLGCFLLFMWFGTDHRVCRWNFNLLWACPFNFIFSFYVQKNTLWVKRYAILVIVFNLILLLSWFVLPQQLPLEVIPVLIALVICARNILHRPRLGW